ncbi:DUF6480 family protein [Streptomyces sp. NPDC090445]|uniref:DUF6480 family protein n=1 Tax=Streptomyces sp. NPDC090445 TaxID=3365963 RepID=UPI00381045D9
MRTNPPDPDPRTVSGPTHRTPRPPAPVPPGETPPAESGTGTGTGPYRPLTRGWARGPLVLIVVLALLVAAFFLAYAIVVAL